MNTNLLTVSFLGTFSTVEICTSRNYAQTYEVRLECSQNSSAILFKDLHHRYTYPLEHKCTVPITFFLFRRTVQRMLAESTPVPLLYL